MLVFPKIMITTATNKYIFTKNVELRMNNQQIK